jgi:hypothetical protein
LRSVEISYAGLPGPRRDDLARENCTATSIVR